jgi:hypothetical protein
MFQFDVSSQLGAYSTGAKRMQLSTQLLRARGNKKPKCNQKTGTQHQEPYNL